MASQFYNVSAVVTLSGGKIEIACVRLSSATAFRRLSDTERESMAKRELEREWRVQQKIAEKREANLRRISLEKARQIT